MKAKTIKKHYKYFSIGWDLENRYVDDVIRNLQQELENIKNDPSLGPEYRAIFEIERLFGEDYGAGLHIAVERAENNEEREARLAKQRLAAERTKKQRIKSKALQEQRDLKEYERLRKKFEKQGIAEDK